MSLGEDRHVSNGVLAKPALFIDGTSTAEKTVSRRSVQEQQLDPEPPGLQPSCIFAIDELTASIAHEVNQPLAAIVTNAEACLRWLNREEPRIDKARANLIAIIRNSLRSSAIVREIPALALSRRASKGRIDINGVVQEAIYFVSTEIAEANVKLRLDLASDLPQAQGDYVQLQQVIINLLTNAVQALSSVDERTREIIVRTMLGDDEIEIAVIDNGPGLRDDMVERVFEPYFTTKETGVGLGLAICRSIASLHSGRLWVTPNTTHGATFHLSLPVKETDSFRGQKAGNRGDLLVARAVDKRVAFAR